MKVIIKYKKSENQGFFNEIEKDLSRVPLKGELIQLNKESYFVNEITTDISDKKEVVILECLPLVISEEYECPYCSECDDDDDSTYISISCSVGSNYNLSDVIWAVDKYILSNGYSENSSLILIDGYLPKEQCIENTTSASWRNYLDRAFDDTVSFYDTVNQKVLRKEMVDFARSKNALVFVIGDIEGSVKEEFNLYQKAGLQIKVIPLPEKAIQQLPSLFE